MADEGAGEFIVVAGHEHHAAALARPAQQLLHHIVVGLGPEPAAPQLPAVHDVAHQVKVIARVVLEKVEQAFGLAAGRAQVQVGDEHRAQVAVAGWMRVVGVGSSVLPTSHVRSPVAERVERGAHQAPRKCLR